MATNRTRVDSVVDTGAPIRDSPDRQHDWRRHALCRRLDPALFFPPGDLSPADRAADERQAKSICATCPVLQACRDFAMTGPEPYGIWGAMTPTERKRQHRRALRFRRTGPMA